MWWNSTANQWGSQDLNTGLSGSAPATAGSPLTSLGTVGDGALHVFYQGTNQHVYRIFWSNSTNNWVNQDLTAAAASTQGFTDLPAAGSPLTSAWQSANNDLHAFFLDTSSHVHHMWWNSTANQWGSQDLNAGLSGSAPAGTASPLTSLGTAGDGLLHVFYLRSGPNVDRLYWDNGGTLTNQDLTTASGESQDSGTVSLSLGDFTATACFGNSTNPVCSGQPVNLSAGDVAAAMAKSLNGFSSPVTATVSGSTISLVWATPGSFTPTVGTMTTVHDQPSLFPNPSFTSQVTSTNAGSGGTLSSPSVTLYSHDTLGNLLQVNQQGGTTDQSKWRIRTFSYDSLSRLLTSQNPESGTISYAYDADSNMLQKTAPQSNQTGSAMQTISYCYDKLNRVTGKAYSAQNCTNGQLPAGTAAVLYTYDTAPNAIGRLISLTDQAGSVSYVYDVLGRMSSESRTITGITNVTKSVGYGYNLGGSLKSVTYPSGSVITYAPDAAGRSISVIDIANGVNYLTGATYGPDSGITGFINGNSGSFAGITNVFTYNPRLQPCRMTASTGAVPLNCADNAPSDVGNVFDISYEFHQGNGDNGAVFAVVNNKDTTRTQTFTYDELNRLSSAQNAGTDCSKMTVNGKTEFWGNSYGYDPWGNLLSKTVTKCSAESLSVSVTAANQLQNGYTYDAAGNMTHDATANLNYSYDQENRITGAAGYTYTYDASGKRLVKSNGSSGTIYWYASVGLIAESDLSGIMQHEYIFFGGARIARKDLPGNAVFYYFSDHLQRASVITDSSGNIKAESDYYPWGGELQLVNNDSNDYKFTGKKRDLETGLDYFSARYYSNSFGRFVTPDWSARPATVPYAHLDNPQTLNLYTYVDNNPTNGLDADGHSPHESIVDPAGSWGTTFYSGVGIAQEYSLDNELTTSADDATNIDSAEVSQLNQQNTLAGSNDYVQAGVDNAKAALQEDSVAQFSSTCSLWLDTIGNGDFSRTSLQTQAANSAAFVYDGASSPTQMSTIGYGLAGTVGQIFTKDQGVMALSSANGGAVWVRSALFASKTETTSGSVPIPAHLGSDGKPTSIAKAQMLHETMHKFGLSDQALLGRMGKTNISGWLGSYVISLEVQRWCF
jgi:RHS repeat-associated protein